MALLYSAVLKILPAQACGDLVLFARGSTGSAIFARMAGTVNTAQYDDCSLAEHSVAMYKPCLLCRTVEKLYDWEGSQYFRHAPLVSWKTIIFLPVMLSFILCLITLILILLIPAPELALYCVPGVLCLGTVSRFFLCHEILENWRMWAKYMWVFCCCCWVFCFVFFYFKKIHKEKTLTSPLWWSCSECCFLHLTQ